MPGSLAARRQKLRRQQKQLAGEEARVKAEQIAQLEQELAPVLASLRKLQSKCKTLGHDGEFVGTSHEIDRFEFHYDERHFMCRRCQCHYKMMA